MPLYKVEVRDIYSDHEEWLPLPANGRALAARNARVAIYRANEACEERVRAGEEYRVREIVETSELVGGFARPLEIAGPTSLYATNVTLELIRDGEAVANGEG